MNMIDDLERVIEKAKELPPERQAALADVIEEFLASSDAPFEIPPEHRDAVLEGLAQARRGEFVSDEDMNALWKKCGL